MGLKKIISLVMILLINVSVVFADITLKDDKDLYLQINLFSLKYQSLSGDKSFNYNELFGPKADFIDHISINESIIDELERAKVDRRLGNILYWGGFAALIGGSVAIVANAEGGEIDFPLYLTNLALSTVVSFIGIKFINNAISKTNRAVMIFNNNN